MTALLIGGVLLGLAFPQYNLSWAAWIALAPLLVICLKQSNTRNILRISLLYGLTAYGLIFDWIIPTCRAAGVNMATSALAWAALSAYHALYVAAFAYLMTRGADPAVSASLWPVQAAALWSGLEFVRARAFGGFPWALLADTQWKNLPLVQVSELTGPYGVSFLIVLVNAGLAMLVSWQVEYKARARGLLHPILALLIALFWGQARLRLFSDQPGLRQVQAGRPMSVAILQGNIDQYKKWDDAYEESIRNTYDGLLETAARFKPDLIVWPETAVPGWFPNEAKYARWVAEESRKGGTYELIGAPTSDRTGDYNAAFLLSPDGSVLGRYLKNHLVPFGEYVPFRSLLAPWIRVLNEMGNFSAGDRLTLLETPRAALGVSICFEMIFSDLIRRLHNAGAGCLVNITNDGWFLTTSAPEQHMAASVFRAIENRTYVIRAANTGISCIIQPSGRIQARTALLKTAVLMGDIAPTFRRTLYDRWGDAFAWACLAGFAGCFLWNRRMS